MTRLKAAAATIGDLWRSSALIQGIMALTGFFTICYLQIVGRPIGEILGTLVGAIVGYYFGTKTTQKE